MSTHRDKLGTFLREVSNWSWDEFVLAEKNTQYTSNEAIIFALVRACALQKLDAIKMAVNRLDGKLKTPIRIEYPKIFYLYPNAGLPPGSVTNLPTSPEKGPVVGDDKPQAPELEIIMPLKPPPAEPEPERDLPSMSFRETLALMSDYPRELPEQVVALALQTEQSLRNQAPRPPDGEIPRVKSVVAAHLLIMAQSRNMDAIGEVFDAIDGKLVETLQVLGEDIFITNYSTVAPPGAELNKDGVLQMEAMVAQDMWAQKLAKDKL